MNAKHTPTPHAMTAEEKQNALRIAILSYLGDDIDNPEHRDFFRDNLFYAYVLPSGEVEITVCYDEIYCYPQGTECIDVTPILHSFLT